MSFGQPSWCDDADGQDNEARHLLGGNGMYGINPMGSASMYQQTPQQHYEDYNAGSFYSTGPPDNADDGNYNPNNAFSTQGSFYGGGTSPKLRQTHSSLSNGRKKGNFDKFDDSPQLPGLRSRPASQANMSAARRRVHEFSKSRDLKEKGRKKRRSSVTQAAAGNSFSDRFFSVLQRMFQQKWRAKVDLALGIVIPLIFIVITIILWGAWGTDKFDELLFTTPNATDPFLQQVYYFLEPCYTKAPIALLNKCGLYPYIDMPEYKAGTIPVNGLAVHSVTPSVKSVDIVRRFLAAFLGRRALVPSFDLLVLHQWLARISPRGDGGNALVSAGLAPNTRETAIQYSGPLFFVGSPAVTNPLVQYFYATTEYARLVTCTQFTSMDAALEARSNLTSLWAIINIISFTADNFDIEIHMNKNALPRLKDLVNPRYPGGFQFDQTELYVASGFLTLQQMVSDHYMNTVLKANLKVSHFIGSLATPPYQQSPLLTYALDLIPMIYAMAFLYPVSQMTKKIVLEKELKLREAMLIMGLTQLPMYLSWFIVYLLENFLVCFIITIMLRLTYVTQSDPFILFLVFFLFSLTTIPLAGLLAAFFSKARLAALVSPIVYFVLAIPRFAMTDSTGVVILVLSLLSPTALAQATYIILSHEVSGGFTSKNFASIADDPQMWVTLVIMVADLVLYYVLMLYLDAVLPKDWGTPKHPLFFILDPIKMCCGGEKKLVGGQDGRSRTGVFEDIDYTTAAVTLEGMRKVFRRGGKKFVAVNNLYWAMNEGEISVLLGHNGAGKSTAMNIMTGMLEPDEGDCYIYGRSVRRELELVRREIGFCPQHNILWPELTCREHLEFYAKIKGLKGWALEDAVCRMLHETDLMAKVNYPSSALSGGQKRKLSVAIAFVGRSRLIFLDEPTAGMDVGARRYTWELLRRMADTHTILLTTHYMDEADLLGQRIGIMSHGRLQCSGSSVFLKSRLGVGYNITLALELNANMEGLYNLVQQEVPTAEVLGSTGCELTCRLPTEFVDRFPILLSVIETNRRELGVRGYSLSATTLEEIFLSVSEATMKQGTNPLSVGHSSVEGVWNCQVLRDDRSLWWLQFKTMMKKRFFNAMRDRRMQCFQVVCPVLCVLLAMLLNLVNYSSGDSLLLSNSIYTDGSILETNGCDAYFGPTVETLSTANLVRNNYLTTMNLSMAMLDTWRTHSENRFGAIGCNDTELLKQTCSVNPIVQLYNSSAPHQSAVNMATFYEGIISNTRQLSGAATGGNYSISVKALPSTAKNGGVTLNYIMIGAIIMIPFTFLPSNPVAWVVKERECKAWHLQNVSGLRFVVYWLSNFLFDICAYIITATLVIIIFLIFQRKEYIGADRVGPTIVLFLVYGLSSTVVAYAASFLFSEHSTAQTVVMAISFVTGFLLVMLVYILSLLPSTKDTSDILRWIFRVVPSYCIGEGIINLAMLDQQQGLGDTVTPWSMDTIGWALVYMSVEFPLFLLITLLFDHPWWRVKLQRMSYKAMEVSAPGSHEDTDVESERQAAKTEEYSSPFTSIVLVVDLRKKYPSGTVAVKNLSFGIMPGEVFGFLGTNGAGKTTAISILCQEFLPTSGRAYICGYDIVKNGREALQCIGYCPQFDACLDLLTVEEHLYLYAGVRGIVPRQHDQLVTNLIEMCGLTEYRKTLSHELSGGNRRKLSVAMSLVGGPRVVFLDEPSAGMDPVARRGLWTAIRTVAANCSVVLTTHHLEEVEALADCVAIMVDGTLRCIGDKTHLKKKYGSGFEMSLRIEDVEYRQDVEDFMMALFPDATLNEFRSQRFVYALPPETSLAEVFSILQEYKYQLGISDYTVSQTTMEQVFLRVSGDEMSV